MRQARAETKADLVLSPGEPELKQTTRLASRGGRSERDCGLSPAAGCEIEELLPRAQRFTDARTREVLRVLDIEADAAALRRSAVELDPRKTFILAKKERFPKIAGRALCLVLDNADILPRQEWSADAGGSRLWRELWDHPATKGRVRRYVYGVRRA